MGFGIGAGGISLALKPAAELPPVAPLARGGPAVAEGPADQVTVEEVTEIVDASRALDQLHETIASRSAELRRLEALIAERRGELDRLEATLVERGLELDRIVTALRSGDYRALSEIDAKLQEVAVPESRLMKASLSAPAASELATAPSGAEDFSSDIRRIGEIVQEARLRATPAERPDSGDLLVEIHFERGSSTLTIGGRTRAMAAAQVVSEMKLH